MKHLEGRIVKSSEISWSLNVVTYLGLYEIYMMEFFVEIVNGF